MECYLADSNMARVCGFVSAVDVRGVFEKYGKVLEVLIVKDYITGRNRGYGFVTIDDESSRRAVFTDKHQIRGKKVGGGDTETIILLVRSVKHVERRVYLLLIIHVP